MLTRIRAKEVVEKASEWPYWGAYSKFMTDDEKAHVQYIFMHCVHGWITFAGIVRRIAEELPLPELNKGVPPYEEFISGVRPDENASNRL